MQGVISKQYSAEQQGEVLGVLQGIKTFATLIGPLVYNYAFSYFVSVTGFYLLTHEGITSRLHPDARNCILHRCNIVLYLLCGILKRGFAYQTTILIILFRNIPEEEEKTILPSTILNPDDSEKEPLLVPTTPDVESSIN